MVWSFLILIGLCLIVATKWKARPSLPKPRQIGINEAELDAAEKALSDDTTDWVVLTRLHGPAYNHGVMAEIVGELSSQGVEATYDVISSSSADAGVTNYMLKVARGSEAAAGEILRKMGRK